MRYEIALVLGFIGLAGGGVPAAIVCFIIGLIIEYLQHSTKGLDKEEYEWNGGAKVDFAQALLVLVAHVMNADGVAKKSELSTVKQLLLRTYGEQRTSELLITLRSLIKNPAPIFATCRHVRAQMAYGQRFDMLRVLFRVAMADGEISGRELEALSLASTHLGIQSADFLRLRSLYFRNNSQAQNSSSNTYSSATAYSILGINKATNEQEAKRAFRKLALQFHPDKYSGKPAAEQDKAEEQFIKIKRAYDTVKQERGWD